MERKTDKIEVGIYQDKVGFTLFVENEKEHFLFSVEVAQSLIDKMQKCIHVVKDLNKQMGAPPGDSIGISEYVKIKIVGGDSGESKDETKS